MLSAESKRGLVAVLGFLFLASLLVVAYREVKTERSAGGKSRPIVPVDSKECVDCHAKTTPGILKQWETSRHAQHGIGCLTCHIADSPDAKAETKTAANTAGKPPTQDDGFVHHGVRIVTIVSPADCGRCHPREAKEFAGSRHAEAANFAGSLDGFLGEKVTGGGTAQSGCQGCHGSVVKVLGSGKLDPTTWPNGGIGRINPDGSRGSCTACHYRHDFSLPTTRGADTCGRCHMGPSHPQMEIFNDSKHGVQLRAQHDQMALDSKSWIAGRDYSAAPTCATCHMSATPTQPVTHDTGSRLAWNLRPVVSVHQRDFQDKRDNMVDVCSQCHAEQWVTNYFQQFDRFVQTYNRKFAEPAQAIMAALYAQKVLTPTPFDEPIEFTYYELWHHEGRRARSGAAMMAPDYVGWQGMYEVAKNFYGKLVPEAERLKPGITAPHLRSDDHAWRQGASPEELKAQLEFYRQRYTDPEAEKPAAK
jgi:hydroxylamine dehydrogenase